MNFYGIRLFQVSGVLMFRKIRDWLEWRGITLKDMLTITFSMTLLLGVLAIMIYAGIAAL